MDSNEGRTWNQVIKPLGAESGPDLFQFESTTLIFQPANGPRSRTYRYLCSGSGYMKMIRSVADPDPPHCVIQLVILGMEAWLLRLQQMQNYSLIK